VWRVQPGLRHAGSAGRAPQPRPLRRPRTCPHPRARARARGRRGGVVAVGEGGVHREAWTCLRVCVDKGRDSLTWRLWTQYGAAHQPPPTPLAARRPPLSAAAASLCQPPASHLPQPASRPLYVARVGKAEGRTGVKYGMRGPVGCSRRLCLNFDVCISFHREQGKLCGRVRVRANFVAHCNHLVTPVISVPQTLCFSPVVLVCCRAPLQLFPVCACTVRRLPCSSCAVRCPQKCCVRACSSVPRRQCAEDARVLPALRGAHARAMHAFGCVV
jgi:hypothetical protein